MPSVQNCMNDSVTLNKGIEVKEENTPINDFKENTMDEIPKDPKEMLIKSDSETRMEYNCQRSTSLLEAEQNDIGNHVDKPPEENKLRFAVSNVTNENIDASIRSLTSFLNNLFLSNNTKIRSSEACITALNLMCIDPQVKTTEITTGFQYLQGFAAADNLSSLCLEDAKISYNFKKFLVDCNKNCSNYDIDEIQIGMSRLLSSETQDNQINEEVGLDQSSSRTDDCSEICLDSNIEGQEMLAEKCNTDRGSLSNFESINSDVSSIASRLKNEFDPQDAKVETDRNGFYSIPNVSYEEERSVLLSAWNELRSSLRQLHRTIVPSTVSSNCIINHQNRPSINRIKALSNMLFAHDPHQLFIRVNQLNQELCIELKVRLLAAIHDNPDVYEASSFIQGLCQLYEKVIGVCETVQTAFEKLDCDHLSHFGLNWMTINMHTFYTTVFTDLDVQEYISLCQNKVKESTDAKEVLLCLSSLSSTLAIAEEVWATAEMRLHEYNMERLALNPKKRSLLSEWDHKYYMFTPEAKCPQRGEMVSTANLKIQTASIGEINRESSAETLNDTQGHSSLNEVGKCECHFCNSSTTSLSISNALPSGLLPPPTQPQLSLYPHIHGTSIGSCSANQGLPDIPTLAGPLSSKAPKSANMYLGSDVLTEQLIREWDLLYGDTLALPGTLPVNTSFQVSKSSATFESPIPTNIGTNTGCSNVPTVHTVDAAENILAPVSIPSESQPRYSSNPSALTTSANKCHNHEPQRVLPNMQGKGKCCGNYKKEPPLDNESGLSETEPSDSDEWSSGDESDMSSSGSSVNHKGSSHCDCCYCHVLHNVAGSGRQKYSDRRERLLKILNSKKHALSSGASCGAGCGASCTARGKGDAATRGGAILGHQTIDDIINYIEGKRTSSHKRTAKRAKQKERWKNEVSCHRKDTYDDYEDEDEEQYKSCEEIEEEEDGPLAELRRRAPDVTITVVKPGQQNQKRGMKSQMNNMNTDTPVGGKHPLVAKPGSPLGSSTWNASRDSTGRMNASVGSPTEPSTYPPSSNFNKSSGAGLSSLLKGMESLSKGQQDKDGGKNSSQMVTIRRVMDPVSAEPTVTITLKGEEPKKDKVLFKLVNGQACQGDGLSKDGQSRKGEAPTARKVKQPQEKPVYNIPEGTDPEEAKRMKKRMKKDRQKQRKEMEKLEEQKMEQMRQLQLKKQHEYLKQQEEQIKKQRAAIQRQQRELLRQQGKGTANKKKRGRKGGGANVSAVVYDGDDVARNFNLPPGVSINRVAGQPGMVTISNTMGNPFAQPFLPNPGSMYPNPLMQGYANSPQGYPMAPSNNHLGYSTHGMYGGCGSGMPWNGGIDPCTGTPQESVIVVDTKSSSTKSKSQVTPNVRKRKSFEEMTSEEKIEAAVRGEVDISLLNQTQKKKYKKCLKAIKEEEEKLTPKRHRRKNEKGKLSSKSTSITKNKNTKSKELPQSTIGKSKGNPPKGTPKQKLPTSTCMLQQPSRPQNTSLQKSQASRSSLASQKQKQQVQNHQMRPKAQTASKPSHLELGTTKPPNPKKTQVMAQPKPQNAKKTQVTPQPKLQTAKKAQIIQQPKPQNPKKTQVTQQLQPKQQNPKKTQVTQQPKPQNAKKTQVTQQPKPQNPKKTQVTQQPKPQNPKKTQVTQQPKPQNPKKTQVTQQPQPKQQNPKKTQVTQQPKPQNPKKTQVTQQPPQNPKKTQVTQQPQPKQQNPKKTQVTQQPKPQNPKKTQVTQQPKPQNPKKTQITSQPKPQNVKKKDSQPIKDNVVKSAGNSVAKQDRQKNRQMKQEKQQRSNQPKNTTCAKTFDELRSYSAKTKRQPMLPGKSDNMYSYAPTLGYAAGDIGHEARYAQYLAANASTLANVEYEANMLKSRAGGSHKKTGSKQKNNKRRHLEDMTTIDSVFTPKDTAGGELDETDREVEAFKRFCLYNVPRNSGQKPKVNFNVKDIMIKKKH